ncbi:Ionotropic receptor 8 [Gryllus bimaculatus]|nr:Ionotropic receptor 8 [Gryllus bimaculatus]
MPRGYISSSSDCARGWWRRGWDADILFALAQHTGNARGCVQVAADRVFANGSMAGGMLQLARGRVDLHGKARNSSPLITGALSAYFTCALYHFCTARYPEIALGRVVSFLYPHRQENLCVMVRRNWHSAHMALPSFSVHICALAALVLLLFWAALAVAFRAPPQRAALEVARTFITGAFATAERRLMVWLSVFSFVVMNAFSGALVGALVAPDHEAQVDTLAQVNALYDVVYSTKVTAEAIANIGREEDPVAYALARKVRSLGQPQWRQVISAAASGAAPAAVLSTETGLDIFRSYPSASAGGAPLFHKVRECVLSPAFYAFPVRARWRLHERWSGLLQRLVEAGLVDKWCADNLARIARENNGTRAAGQRPGAPTSAWRSATLRAPPGAWRRRRAALLCFAAERWAATVGARCLRFRGAASGPLSWK